MPTIICSWCLAAFGDNWDAAVEHEKTCEYNQDVLDEDNTPQR